MSDPWTARLRSIWPYATFAAALCFLTTGAVGTFVVWRGGAEDGVSYMLSLLDPALATLVFLAVSVASPNVFLGRQYGLLHSFTLPTIYIALVYGIKSLGRYSGANAQRIEDALRTDLLWLNLQLVFTAWAVLVLVFLFIGNVLGAAKKPQQ